MKKNISLCDYIYIDHKKIISVYSQLTGEVVSARDSLYETVHIDHKKKYKLFKQDAGNTTQDTVKEYVKPQHALFQELEEGLLQQGHMLDLSNQAEKIRDKKFRGKLKDTFCIKVTGRSVIEHYERMKNISESFPNIATLINQSNKATVKSTDAYKDLLKQINIKETEIAQIKDRNARNIQMTALKEKKKRLALLLEESSQVGKVEQWILDGLKTWIDTFISGIINLRVYPLHEQMDVQIFGNLKQENFVDTDTSSFHFTYGSIPTEEITMLGIVTSVPMEEASNFNPHQEFDDGRVSDKATVERGFRGVFRGFESFEQMVRTCRYPRVLVTPLLVYRQTNKK
ncbi:MAG: hypothetical protein D3923_10015 [Candidatus Electrothrix sp. AR3]|nr:hypothetical protein [Candidatus Electrothrix sp. AR3]